VKLSIIDPREDARWDQFVLNHRFGSVFHLSSWCDILVKTFHYKPFYVVLEEDSAIKAGLPLMTIKSWITGRRVISLPRTSYCDPLVEEKVDLEMLLQGAREVLRKEKCGFLEIKTQKNDQFLLNTELKCYGHFRNQVLDLTRGIDALWKGFHRTCVRQRIQRAEKDNVLIRLGESLSDVGIFYKLHMGTTDKHGVPPRPLCFFENMWNELQEIGNIILPIAERNGTPAAAAIFLKSKDAITFEFLGIDYEMAEHSPGHLIGWEMIKRACSEGTRYFDFGLTPPENTGLMQFKTRWGAEDRVLNYFYYPDVKGYKAFVKQPGEPGEEKADFISTTGKKLKRYAASRLYRHFG
jgi:hypothetical protein